MENTTATLTAITTELAPLGRGLGVAIRDGDLEIAYIEADGLEEHAPMDWTPAEATELLRANGYRVIGEWEDIDPTEFGDDPTWRVTVTETESSRSICN